MVITLFKKGNQNMSKILVLAEKPSVAAEIARVLGCRKKGNGSISGDKYIITWALGHLIELADPEHYNPEYKQWSIEQLPMLPKKMDLKVIDKTAKQYKAVKSLMKSNEVSELVIATDAGREGELVARWIIAKTGFDKPIKRLWISSQTDKAIRDGFAHLHDGKEYMNLYMSAQARAEADWLVGLNVTRALTCKFNAQLSAGRVQTPTLALICRREEEIRKFVPKEFYTIHADLGRYNVTYRDKNNQTSIFDKKKAEDIATAVKNKEFTALEVSQANKRTPAPMLYDLTELQRDANKLYGFSAKQTLNTMQRLYEHHKALTYPRTDSRYLTADIVPTLGDRIKAISFGNYKETAQDIIRGGAKIHKACVNDAKVSDHHAIIPTEERPDIIAMSNDELKIYNLVIKRFLACFMPDYEYRSVNAVFGCGEYKFYASGSEVISQGWKKVYNGEYLEDEETEPSRALPPLEKWDKFPCRRADLKQGRTKPPARYTEASLLSAMENPSRFIEDKEMKNYIGGGLGTPATRADIIEKLFNSFYIERRGNDIVATSKGEQVVKLAPKDLVEPLLTAKWEMELDKISRGKNDKNTFIKGITDYTKELVSSVIKSDAEYVHDNMTRKPCPECGKLLLSVNGKHGKMLVCQDRECGYRERISTVTNARCPECHKKMDMINSKGKKIFVCKCGFRESMEQHETRTKGSKSAATKSFTRQYLKNQNKQQYEEESEFAKLLRMAAEKK